MPTSGGPGKQAMPKAIRAMPAARAAGIATPASGSPSNNCPTSEGAISNANPVAASPIAAKISAFFIWPDLTQSVALAILFGNGWKPLGLRLFNRIRLRRCHRPQFCPGLCQCFLSHRFELERQLVDLSGELEWHIAAILQHPYPLA